ncbi:MAG TPA: hypothetical protein VFE84_00015 [Patescibacteria group bacterium]|jgi:hypothetical protein|nr:hypothetical protein [Patescibacteria group bacterium]
MKSNIGLDLEIEEIEHRTKPGCNSSSTSPLCTCPVILSSDSE